MTQAHWAASYFGGVWLVRLVLQRGLAAVYFVAFLTVKLQCKPLIGERGLLPAPEFLRHAGFWASPSLFHWKFSDRLLDLVAWLGLLLSACALLGWTEQGSFWLSLASWLTLYVLYLSVVSVGQRFFAFGWESMLLEAGFFAAFLGSAHMRPSLIPVLALRWMLFRTELGAGLIKLRHDPCWRDLTCLYFHYETQPLPNPLSWYFHRLPRFSHRAGVLFSHFVQVVVPFGLFAPQPYASLAAALCTAQQLWLIVSGNYSWLNWLTAVLGAAGCCDLTLARLVPVLIPGLTPSPLPVQGLLYILAAVTVLLSVRPVLNLFSRHQAMNRSYNPLHLVNTYGAFGSVTRERFELILEGTADRSVTAASRWQEYGFRGKPGDPCRMPPQVAPYHLRLDWMLWFVPFTVRVTAHGLRFSGYDLWFLRFVQRLLTGDAPTLRLLRQNPFLAEPPAYVRALMYRYHYTDAATRASTGAWWTRELVGTYLEPVSLDRLAHL